MSERIGPERKSVDACGVRVSYLEQGVAKAGVSTLVMLHGICDEATTFLPLMECLDEKWHVIAIDFPGGGHSEKRSDIDASMAAMVDLLACFLDQLGVARCILFGHSQGGSIALRFAAKFPERVERLVLLSPAHPDSERSHAIIRGFMTLPGRFVAYTLPWYPRWFVHITMRIAAGPGSWKDVKWIEEYTANLRRPGTISHIMRQMKAWKGDMEGLASELRAGIKGSDAGVVGGTGQVGSAGYG